MSDTWTGSASTAWFTGSTTTSSHGHTTITPGNWTSGTTDNAPTISATGNETIVISGTSTNQPVIPATHNQITVVQSLITSGNTYTTLSETQIGGESITLTNGANLSIQGNAVGIFYGNTADTITATGGTITGLHGATSTIANYDSHMSIIATGTADTLTVEAINENFGLISIGGGDTLTINNTYGNGANPQALHGLINYGLITVAAGGHLNITAEGATGTYANFYNAGWIEVDGGTLSISSSVLDGANNASSATTADGYIEIGSSGDVILSNTVSATEEVTFTDTTANTLQVQAGTLFSGTVNNFGPSDSIVVNGFTSTSNATITTVGGVIELITTNGSVLTTITLTGTTSNEIDTSYNSATSQEVITGGGSHSYSSGTHTLSAPNGTLTNTSTITVSGSTTNMVVVDPVTGTGAFFIDYGATLSLDNTTGNDSSQTVIFGTHGSTAALNTLLVNDGTAGFGGTVTGFGSGDDILLGGSTLPALTAGEGVMLNYNTTSHALTISETNASGTVVGTETMTITGIGTTALSTGSFIGLETTAGLNIEIAPTAATNYTFSTSGTGSFESPAYYKGGTAPGDLLSAHETVTIAAGTASVSAATLTDNGVITVASGAGFIDAGSLTGTGTLAVSGTATLTGATSLASITETGTGKLTLGGTDAAAITIASGGQATIASGFSDSAAITGAGSLTVNAGVTATLSSGSVASVADLGTLDLTGSFSGAINMEGNSANTAVDFNTANDTAVLTNFGTTDKITLSSGALTETGATGAALSYNGSVLTVTETNASGGSISSDSITVSGVSTLSASSFVALQTTNGVVVELASNLAGTGFTYDGTGVGSFEAPGNYAGSTAPGDSITTGESVTIGTGTASVSTGGVTDNGSITVANGAGFTDHGSLTGTGTLNVGPGATATLGGSVSLGSIVDAGTIDITGTAGVSAIDMHGNGADSVLVLTSASSIPAVTDFGTTDEIIASGVSIPSGDGLVLSYNSGTGVLTSTETASNGSVIGTSSETITGVPGTTLSTSSFVALEGANGLTIELAPTVTSTYDFSASGTGSFESPADYTGGTAPGDMLSSYTTVAITAGTASVSSGGVTDNGLITIANGTGFIDAGTLSGTGALVVGTGGNATLAGATSLASITDNGSLTLAGTDAAAITLGTGAAVTLSGNFSDSSAINGAGSLTVGNGVTATLASGSIASIADHGTLDLNGSFGGSIDMEGNGADTVVKFTGTSNVTGHTLNTAITNLGYGDSIAIGTADFALNGTGDVLHETLSNGVLTVTDVTSGASLNIDLGLTSGDLAQYLTVSAATGELTVTLCFYPGTALATPDGEIKVEDIVAGDMLMTANGAKPVRWIGQSHIHTGFADPLRSLPIRIRQGALGGGLPVRDLLLSPGHAIAIDDVLVHASALVNGSTIIREYDVPEQFTYYHVELATHELLIAEGVEAESFVDNVDRMHFHNWNDREAPETAITEMDLPRAKSARQVPTAIRNRLGLSRIAVA